MYLLIIILYAEEHLDDILSCLVELGLEDAVTVDSEPLKKVLAYKVPIFAGLKFDLRETPFTKLILAISENKDAGEQLLAFLKDVGVDFQKPGVGRVLTMKLESAYGEPELLGDI